MDQADNRFKGEKLDVKTIIHQGLDLLNTLSDHLRKDIGVRFDEVWRDCQDHMKGLAKALLFELKPDKENLEMNAYVIQTRYEAFEGNKDEMALIYSFDDFIGLLLRSLEEYLGRGPVNEAIEDAIGVMSMIKKYKSGSTTADFFIERLQERMGSEESL